MKKSQRRVPRKIGIEDEEESTGPAAGSTATATVTTTASHVVKRPLNSKTSSKPSIRLPHRVPLSDTTPTPQSHSLYTAEALSDLKNTTPRAPARATSHIAASDSDHDEPPTPNADVDITSKFGTSTPTPVPKKQPSSALIPTDDPSRIPSAAEIAEKKARRNRLRLEQSALDPQEDYISLHSSSKTAKPIRRASDASSVSSASSDDGRRKNGASKGSLIIPAEELELADKYGRQESRLQHEDEDIAEGFDDFVEDSGRVTLNKRGRREQDAQRKRDMAETIRRAERMGSDSSSSGGADDSESEDEGAKEEKARIAAYEAAQTKAGTYSTRHTGSGTHNRQREQEAYERLRQRIEMPTKLPPIPTPGDVQARFKNLLLEKETGVKSSEEHLAALRREREELRTEEERVKGLLDEAAARFEKVRAELPQDAQAKPDGDLSAQGRGLESLGGLSAQPPEPEFPKSDAAPRSPVLQASMAPPPIPSGMAGRPTAPEDDYY
ncbi:MAG: hypothetical protein M1828_004295 [Chrysothrix sp. TS-e1954]|nr:MAG: hypothetical protein M1828_004295 [Chrysothrix sp. TS-e1954]